MTLKVLTAAVLAIAVVASPLFPAVVAAAPNQVNGTIYWDQNNNGKRDSGEPGVPGIVVSFGWGANQKSAVTDTNGGYIIAGTSGSARATVHTGWFRSACNSLNCSVGQVAGNDFEVTNQIVTRSGVNGTAGATLNAGLVPSWGGGYPIPANPNTTETDIAARLTYNSGCATNRVCTPGQSIKQYVWIFNQGTTPLSNPEFVVEMGVGHALDDNSWTDPSDVYNIAHPTANTITILEPYDTTKGYGRYRMNGTIPAGANSSAMFMTSLTNAVISTATPYPTGDPYDKQPAVRIVKVDQTGDPDSSFCEANGATWRTGSCAFAQLGVHDKTKSLDHSDGTGINIGNGTPVTRVYDLAAETRLADGQPAQVAPGSEIAYVLRVTNKGAGEASVRNVKLKATVPSAMQFSTSSNPGWVLENGSPVTYVTAQVLPGDHIDVPLHLQLHQSASLQDNGTSAVYVQGEVLSLMWNHPSASGLYSTVTDANPLDNVSTNAAVVITEPGDNEPAEQPAPQNLIAAGTGTTSIQLNWDITGTPSAHHVYRDTQLVEQLPGSANTYTDHSLQSDTTHQYYVVAVGSAGQQSVPSNVSSAATYQEFVTNRSVESAITGWSDLWNPATTTVARAAGDAHDGNYAVKVTSSSSSRVQGGFTNYANSTRFLKNLQQDKTYTTSAWVKPNATGIRICIRLTEYTAAGSNQGNTESCQTLQSTAWQQLSVSRTALASGNSMTISVYGSNINTSNWFLTDSFSAYRQD